jgi:UDP-N-acetylglucosamine 2-epimerase (non-hydrolysing)
MPVRVVVVAGARPNFMKVAPLWAILSQDKDFQNVLVHTGQHFDDAMSGQFFRDLGLPAPDCYLGAGGGSHAQQTAEIMKRIEPVLVERKPDGVLVVGDVNSTIAAALVAKKLGIAVVHVEAGLRSFDRSMPEEINRVLTDAISDLLLITEESGRVNLVHEGIDVKRIHMVGNLMIDSLHRHLEQARQSKILAELGLVGQRFGMVTLHRPANVDQEEPLEEILGALEIIAQEIPLIWPVHPRTKQRLTNRKSGRPLKNVRLLDPLGYLDFLCLQAASGVILTDSGGIQEESTVLGVPCLTVRENTERPVTIEYGTNRLVGTRKASIVAGWEESKKDPKQGRIPPLWDGQAGLRCHSVLKEYFQGSL